MRLVLVLLVLLSSEGRAWECNDEQRGMESGFDDHVDLATEIYLGRVTNAYLVADAHKIVFELEVSGVFKGRYMGFKTLQTTDDGLDPSIAIGHSYVFFLYGSDEVNFCGHHLNLGKRNYDFETLREVVYGDPILEPSVIGDLKALYERVPPEP